MQHSNAANRLDRLPIARFHKVMLAALSFAYFFEFADINSFATTAPKLIKPWGLTVNQIAYVTSLSFVGMFIGSLVASWIADRWGRKIALSATTLFFSVFSLLSAFTWDIVSLGVCRVLTSAGLSAMTVVGVIYLSEMFPAAVRGKYQAYAIVIGICGTPATNLLASAIVPLTDWSWRLVYVWGALGILVLILINRLVESPRWYESRGEYARADAILREIEEQVGAERGPLPEPTAAGPQDDSHVTRAPLRLLLQKRYLGPTLLLTVLWVTQTIGFFGYSTWAPTLLAKEGFSVESSIFYVALSTVGAPLGSFLAALVTDRFERKWCLVVFGAAIAVCGLLYGMTFNPILIVVFGFLVNLIERGYTALAYAYSPELFDIRGRSLGTGVSYGLGRLSNALGPLVIAALYVGAGYQSVFAFIAGTWLFGALVLAVFGPRTRPRRAPQAARAATGGELTRMSTVTDSSAAPVPVVDTIRDAIVDGEFAPNQRLVEADLSERFGASRGSVRAALLQLGAEGLVERVQNRGARVRAISLAEAIEITEVRMALEGLCAAKAATRLTDDDRDHLRRIGAAMQEAVRSGDLLGYSELNQQLHSLIRMLGGQSTAQAILQRLRGQNVRHQFRLALHPGRAAVSLPQHLEIIEALCAGDADAAESAVRRHLHSVIDTLPDVSNRSFARTENRA